MHKLFTFFLLLMPSLASAASLNDWGYDDFTATNIALGSKDLRATIGGIINIILGFLGILTTLAILWGGFNMMTSYGNAEKNEKRPTLFQSGPFHTIVFFRCDRGLMFQLNTLCFFPHRDRYLIEEGRVLGTLLLFDTSS